MSSRSHAVGLPKALRAARKVLAVPQAFDLYQWLIGAPAAKRRFVTEFVRPEPGDRVLDVGCATGALCEYVPAGVTYVGVDLDPDYIDAARLRFGGRGEFVCADVTQYEPDKQFDVVMASGLYHHLDDDAAVRALRGAAHALKPTGRIVVWEPVFEPPQSAVERFVLRSDRGAYVRDTGQWLRLFEQVFGAVESTVIRRTYRIPFSMLLVRASKP